MATSQTLEVWCIPTSATPLLDHTFVYCPDNGQVFGCWNSGDTQGADALRVASATYPGAYDTANCYRCPEFGCPDTADVGVYGINGVCHQSANRFFYAVSASPMGLVNWRPGGLLLSCAAYGPWGTMGGFLGTTVVFGLFLTTTYGPCAKSGEEFAGARPERVSDSSPVVRDLRHVYETAAGRSLSANDVIVAEFAVLARHMAATDVSDFAASHRQLLSRKDDLIRAGWDGQSKVVRPELAENLNSWALTVQHEMASSLGTETLRALTGADARPFALVDMDIVNKAWHR